MADRVRPSVSLLTLKRGMVLRKERGIDGDSKGLRNCWWSQPSAHIPMVALRLDLCMSSVYPSQSEHLWTNTHNTCANSASASASAHKQICLSCKCRQVCRLSQLDFTTALSCTRAHTYTHIYTCLAAIWEADLTDTSSRSLMAQVLPAAEVHS